MAVSTSSAGLFQPQHQQRALLACVAASIVLHAGVLIAFPQLRGRAAPSPVVLTAVLLSPAAVHDATPAPAQPARAEPPRSKPRTRTAAQAEPHPEVTPAVPTAAPEPPPPTSQPAAPQVAEAASAAPVQDTAPAQPALAWDGATLQQYRTGLIAFAKQFKRYPAQAMERGWEGRVEIRITVRPTGTIDNARVKTPSGYRILDEQALDMVRRALARTPVPPALVGREFSVDIPVIFELQG
jgi:periplasmic protein TonB